MKLIKLIKQRKKLIEQLNHSSERIQLYERTMSNTLANLSLNRTFLLIGGLLFGLFASRYPLRTVGLKILQLRLFWSNIKRIRQLIG